MCVYRALLTRDSKTWIGRYLCLKILQHLNLNQFYTTCIYHLESHVAPYFLHTQPGNFHMTSQCKKMCYLRAVSPQRSLLPHTIQENKGSFRQRAKAMIWHHWIAAHAHLKEHKSDNFYVPFLVSWLKCPFTPGRGEARGGAGLRDFFRFMYVSIWRHLDNTIKSGWFRKFLLPRSHAEKSVMQKKMH